MDKTQKQKVIKNLQRKNILESIKDIGESTTQSIASDLVEQSTKDFLKELLGINRTDKSGELFAGQELAMNEVFDGKAKEKEGEIKQTRFENTLIREEKERIEHKSNELKLHLHALMQEIYSLAKTTQNLGQEVEVATMQAPANPGVYHVVFFEKMIEYIRDFRKKIEDSSVWLSSSNKRAEKKNYWSMYKKKGSSFLLAPDHYLQRSVG